MKKAILIIGVLVILLSLFSGCITEKNYYEHYTGKLIAVEPYSGTIAEISFYFEDKVISLDTEDTKTTENVFNECSKLINKNVTLVYDRINLIYIYCFEILEDG